MTCLDESAPAITTTTWQPPTGRHTIRKKFRFAAAHHLTSLPASHRCSGHHGHTYTVEVFVSSRQLRGPGWITNVADLKPLGEFIDRCLDHQDLNEVLPVEPTSEHLAAWIADWCLDNLVPDLDARFDLVTVDEGGDHVFMFRPDQEPS